MKSILDFLAEIEKLAYKILLWIIFIPKTIVQITLSPGWAPDYVRGELKQEKSPFDEYMSPVILLLVVALIPAVIYQYLPTFGVTVTKHVEKESERQDTIEYWISTTYPVPENTYDAEANFASLSSNMKLSYEWYVEKISYDKNGKYQGYDEIYREIHNEGDENVFIDHVDLNTARNTFYYPFEAPGDYYINVTVTKYDPNNHNRPLESYDNFLDVTVPDINNPEMKGFVSESSTKSKGNSTKLDIELISGQLKKESNILLVFGLLIPPLFFAFATKLFTRKEISENALRETFYAECYYFSPISLAIWATIYAGRFLTNDVFYYYDAAILIVFLPTLLAIIWFISVETNAIAKEEKIAWWKAFLIVLFCLTILLLVGGFIISFAILSIEDGIRKLAIWLYPLAAIGLLTILAISSIRNRRRENQRITIGNTFSFGCLFLVIAATIGLVLLVGKTIPLETSLETATQSADSAPPVSLDAQQTPEPTEPPTPTVVADTPTAEVQPFYTEEFDTDNNNWTYFVVDGGTSRITKADNPKMSVLTDNSLLTFDLNAMNLWVYVTFDSFEYDNVRVDARVTNRGVNNNNVSLICRYTEDGWYEFNIANNGLYWIYAASVDSAGKVEYGPVYDGGSDKIKYGKETNEYSIICNGTTLSLFINGTEARTITEAKYGLTSGKVGIAVSSFDVLPVTADVDWVTISEP